MAHLFIIGWTQWAGKCFDKRGNQSGRQTVDSYRGLTTEICEKKCLDDDNLRGCEFEVGRCYACYNKCVTYTGDIVSSGGSRTDKRDYTCYYRGNKQIIFLITKANSSTWYACL